MSREWLITILDRSKRGKRERHDVVRPSKRSKYLARRLNNPFITFYDCGTRNGADLPILKTPDYSVSPQVSGSFVGAKYTVETFGTSDFQDYYDLLFEIPVEEWKDNYRKLEYEVNPSNPFASTPVSYPQSLTIRSPVTNTFKDVFEDFSANLELPSGPETRRDNLEDFGLCWDQRGLEYRGLEDIELRHRSATNNRDWFSIALNIEGEYKVTATNDPDATDIAGSMHISGKIDVYLIPLVGMFIATSYKGPRVAELLNYDGEEGMQVLGPWYQALPRAYWYRYVNPYGPNDPSEFEAFIEYQKDRIGAQASEWFWLPPVSTADAPIDPNDFRTGNFTWKCMIDNLENPDFYNGTARTFIDHTTSNVITSSEPILLAVLKIRGSFYYVWSIGDSGNDQVDFVNINNYTLSVYPVGDEAP